MFGKPAEVTTGELRVAASSKESLDPSEQGGKKILIFGLLDGFSVLAEDLNRRKELLPLHPQLSRLQRRPDNSHCQ